MGKLRSSRSADSAHSKVRGSVAPRLYRDARREARKKRWRGRSGGPQNRRGLGGSMLPFGSSLTELLFGWVMFKEY